MARRVFVFCTLSLIKTIGHVLFSFNVKTTNGKALDWDSFKVVAWINHTSLYDVFLICLFPYKFLWKASKTCMTPIAEKTIKRPLLGLIFKNLTSKKTFVSQKRDDSWAQFLESIEDSSIVALFPEGRMKRKNGLDKNGKELSIRGGIADILQKRTDGKMLIIYSGGMHHIQAPGEKCQSFFKQSTPGLSQLILPIIKIDFLKTFGPKQKNCQTRGFPIGKQGRRKPTDPPPRIL